MDNNELPEWITEHIPPELAGSTLFKFNVKLQATNVVNNVSVRREITVNMLPDLDLNMDNLESLMEMLPSQYAFWAAVYSEVRLAVSIAERKLKIRRGQAVREVQNQLKSSGLKIPAEQVKHIVEMDEELVKSDMKLSEAQMQCGKLYHMLEALKMKAELDRSLAGFKRQELSQS